ncbi:hypothetical protein KIPB_008645, partial [Kipferlia bialata]
PKHLSRGTEDSSEDESEEESSEEKEEEDDERDEYLARATYTQHMDVTEGGEATPCTVSVLCTSDHVLHIVSESKRGSKHTSLAGNSGDSTCVLSVPSADMTLIASVSPNIRVLRTICEISATGSVEVLNSALVRVPVPIQCLSQKETASEDDAPARLDCSAEAQHLEPMSINKPFAGDGEITSVAASPFHRLVAMCSKTEKPVGIFEVNKKGHLTKITSLSGHRRHCWDLEFAQHTRLLATASADRSVKLWDVSPMSVKLWDVSPLLNKSTRLAAKAQERAPRATMFEGYGEAKEEAEGLVQCVGTLAGPASGSAPLRVIFMSKSTQV